VKSTGIAVVAGAGLALASDFLTRRRLPAHVVPAAAAGLVTAAVIYPAARVGRAVDADVARRERLSVMATSGVLALAAIRGSSGRVRSIVASGWLAHAAFDQVHDKGATSRLPEWYPAVCAGYDIAIAGLLLRA
jgi:hypothetical protein